MNRAAPCHPIVEYLERCFETHGDSHLGFDWPDAEHVQRRHQVMLEVIREPGTPLRLLDFGCGAAHLFETIQARNLDWIDYSGLDLSTRFIEHCREKYPERSFRTHDILTQPLPDSFDYVICNGIFTVKLDSSQDEFFAYMMEVLQRLFDSCVKGLAFNVMSKNVDWERNDLFHLPMDTALQELSRAFGRDIVFRHDYGLYEYTVYLYKSPSATPLLARPFSPKSVSFGN